MPLFIPIPRSLTKYFNLMTSSRLGFVVIMEITHIKDPTLISGSPVSNLPSPIIHQDLAALCVFFSSFIFTAH